MITSLGSVQIVESGLLRRSSFSGAMSTAAAAAIVMAMKSMAPCCRHTRSGHAATSLFCRAYQILQVINL